MNECYNKKGPFFDKVASNQQRILLVYIAFVDHIGYLIFFAEGMTMVSRGNPSFLSI